MKQDSRRRLDRSRPSASTRHAPPKVYSAKEAMAILCKRSCHTAESDASWRWPVGTAVEVTANLANCPAGTTMVVTWPMPTGAVFALGVTPPISAATSIPVAWEFEGVRRFMFCSLKHLRDVPRPAAPAVAQ